MTQIYRVVYDEQKLQLAKTIKVYSHLADWHNKLVKVNKTLSSFLGPNLTWVEWAGIGKKPLEKRHCMYTVFLVPYKAD